MPAAYSEATKLQSTYDKNSYRSFNSIQQNSFTKGAFYNERCAENFCTASIYLNIYILKNFFLLSIEIQNHTVTFEKTQTFKHSSFAQT